MTFEATVETGSLKSKNAFIGLIAELNAEIAQMEQKQPHNEVCNANRLASLMQEHADLPQPSPKGYGAALLAMEQRRQADQP